METRPQNAFEACMQAAEMIERLPLNYIQQTYAISAPKHPGAVADDLPWVGRDVDHNLLFANLIAADNVCHTAYCRAGWIAVVSCAPVQADGARRFDDTLDVNYEYLACCVLGVTYKDRYGHDPHEYLAGIPSTFYTDWRGIVDAKSNPERYGSPAYHTAGADGLRRFAERWRDRLERTTLVYSDSGMYSHTILPDGRRLTEDE